MIHTAVKVNLSILQFNDVVIALQTIEDSLNGKHYPMELHVVSFRQQYKSMKEATLHSDGLVVMA